MKGIIERYKSGNLTEEDALKEISNTVQDTAQQENYRNIFTKSLRTGECIDPATGIQGAVATGGQPTGANAGKTPEMKREESEIQSIFDMTSPDEEKSLESIADKIKGLPENEAMSLLDRKFSYTPNGLSYFYPQLKAKYF